MPNAIRCRYASVRRVTLLVTGTGEKSERVQYARAYDSPVWWRAQIQQRRSVSPQARYVRGELLSAALQATARAAGYSGAAARV